ncbi:MAG: DUF169 domain-containing protein [Armatimonadetes bacterium]|nr:DUF169 domain-containing protein [Armatimonadota bacterium]
MESRIADELKLRFSPVAIILADQKPEEALQFVEGHWGCVVAMFSAAARGKVAAFDRKTVGCPGGGIGLGFCDNYDNMPGGIEYFLSTGRGEGYPEGEGYKKTPELAKAFVDDLPRMLIPNKYVVFKPLEKVDLVNETPVLVSFLANADQLSALVVLANYDRPTLENVSVKFGAGCHTLFLLPYQEAQKEMPKAIMGILDISARPYVEPDLLSFTVPYKMFLEMEANIPGSFLEKKDWKKVRGRIG